MSTRRGEPLVRRQRAAVPAASRGPIRAGEGALSAGACTALSILAGEGASSPSVQEEAKPVRKGFGSRAAIPPELLARLNAGSEEPRTLAEWLAVDVRRLLAAVLPALGLADQLPAIWQKIADPSAAGVMARQKALGAAFFEIIAAHPAGPAIYEGLATYRSGIVREWAALVWTANPALGMAERLAGARRFAADPSMSVREIAWSSFRPYIAAELDRALALLTDWVRDEDANIRRCAIEATRPRGVWCAHLNALKDEPSKALPLLEAVRADESRYVQLSVANWLNDASKQRPDWVRALGERWLAESPTSQTRWIVNHASRTLRKGG